MQTKTNQYLVTVAAGKRLIAKATVQLPNIKQALKYNTIVVLGGTTNSYIAEEFLNNLSQLAEFAKERFFRGINLPPNYQRKSDEEYMGDVILVKGQWKKGLSIFDVADELNMGDIIIKGANAVNLVDQEAAVLIGHPSAGTIGASMLAVIGRRVELIIPVGLEKRISENIGATAQLLNSSSTSGPRYFPIKGNIITELEALKILTGVDAKLVAAGGVCGAEGSYRLAVSGTQEQLAKVDKIVEQIVDEPPFVI